MSKESPLKSAYELALERLAKRDREAGVEHAVPLTDAQKAEIARLRQESKAKQAELEILHGKNLEGTQGDPAKIAEVEEHLAIDRRRVDSSLESAIARVRRGESADVED